MVRAGWGSGKRGRGLQTPKCAGEVGAGKGSSPCSTGLRLYCPYFFFSFFFFNFCSFPSVLSPGDVALFASLSSHPSQPFVVPSGLCFPSACSPSLWRFVLCSAVMPHACPAETLSVWGSCRWNDWAQGSALQVGQLLPVRAWRDVAEQGGCGGLLLADQPDFLTGALQEATESWRCGVGGAVAG